MSTSTQPGPPVEILIAEDSPTQAQRLRHILEQQGYRVTHAANGRLALAAAQHHKPTLVITDAVMPEMDGYELCRLIKADASLADIPVILTTTLSDPQDVLHGLECGADNFIAKPYTGQYLLGRVQFALENPVGSQTERADAGAEIVFNGRRHFITADRAQILNLLLSSYDAALQRNQELARTQEELRRVNTELAQASRHKDEFLANMSHELRTPLNAILGLSEALLEQISGPLTPRQVKSVTTISTSGAHLLALINDILDLSKIEAGKLELNLDPVNIDEFCQSCLVFVRTQAMHKHIAVAFEPDGRVAEFSADAKRLKQILVNLLTNAVKFTPEGGRIGLMVAAPAEEQVVRFTVWDSGIGIAPEDQAKLFKAFTQIDSGLSRAQEGTGLGLALVAKLTELHGGSVALESGPGKGSRFIVTLPRTAAPGLVTVPRVETDRRGYRRALIIEDDPTAGDQLVRYLAELGLSSVLHPRGEAAMAAALRERPDVILLDLLLPDESGWAVLARFKAHPGTRDIPVVVISVLDEPAKSRALGAAAHFTKPVTRVQLAKFLQRPAVEVAQTATPFVGRAPAQGPLILLAEDNLANIETIGGYLEDKGYQMHYAGNGALAVKLACELRPALILMDVQMPVMDGLTAMKEIRADAALKKIPLVALTALAMPGDRERCLAAGASDYLSKPVSLKVLLALVERLVPGADATRAV